MTRDERYQSALRTFLENSPEVRAELDALSAEVAECVGQTIQQYRDLILSQRFAENARLHGLYLSDHIINLTARDEKERRSLIIADRKQDADNIGLTWEEFCEVNPQFKED